VNQKNAFDVLMVAEAYSKVLKEMGPLSLEWGRDVVVKHGI
jgi:hypothetical protein